jgi:hypothetical protein
MYAAGVASGFSLSDLVDPLRFGRRETGGCGSQVDRPVRP